MTILEPNQPWPKVYMRRWNLETIQWDYGYEDKSIIDVITRKIDVYTHDYYHKPTTLFVGPRAANKIKDLIAQNEFLGNMITTKFFEGTLNDEKKFLGMQLVLTVDDGLWIA